MNTFLLGIIKAAFTISWFVFEVVFVIVYVYLIRNFKISGQKTAFFGFVALGATMIFSVFHLDSYAGKTAEFVWILFAISFIQEFIHFLKYENK